MKYFITLSTLFLCVVSCNSVADTNPKPEQIAYTFLTAYYSLDFGQIVPMCVSESILKSDMELNAQVIGGYPQATIDEKRADLAAYSFQIDHVDLNRAKDSAFISYTIFTPEVPNGIESRLTLIKEEHEWKVAKLF